MESDKRMNGGMEKQTDGLKDGRTHLQRCDDASEKRKKIKQKKDIKENKAGYTATPVACGWAGAIIEVTPSFGQEQ